MFIPLIRNFQMISFSDAHYSLLKRAGPVRDSKGQTPKGGWVRRIARGDLQDGTPA